MQSKAMSVEVYETVAVGVQMPREHVLLQVQAKCESSTSWAETLYRLELRTTAALWNYTSASCTLSDTVQEAVRSSRIMDRRMPDYYTCIKVSVSTGASCGS